jgi:phosphoribosylaminoimidazole-succinocarboxamide synthase
MLNRAVTHATGLPDLSSLEGVERVGSGKVRELYAVGEDLLLVASDRISAFDVVLPTPVPDKGAVLTGLPEPAR